MRTLVGKLQTGTFNNVFLQAPAKRCPAITICLGWAVGGPGWTGLGAWGGPAKAGPPGAFNKGAPGPGTLLKALRL